MCNTADLLLRTHSELILHGTICMSLTSYVSSILGLIQVSFARFISRWSILTVPSSLLSTKSPIYHFLSCPSSQTTANGCWLWKITSLLFVWLSWSFCLLQRISNISSSVLNSSTPESWISVLICSVCFLRDEPISEDIAYSFDCLGLLQTCSRFVSCRHF